MALRRQAIKTIEAAAAGVAVHSGHAGALLVLWRDVEETPAAEARSGHLDSGTVDLYRQAMERDETFPPPRLWRDSDGVMWLGDGRHRWHAHKSLHGEETPLLCEVREGSRRDAFLDASASNIRHGLPATTEQRVANLRRLVADDEWSTWSARAMAAQVGLSPTTVTKYLERWQVARDRVEYRDRHGNTTTMDVSGQRQAAQERRDRLAQERKERHERLNGSAPAAPAGARYVPADPIKTPASKPQPVSFGDAAMVVRRVACQRHDGNEAAFAWLVELAGDEIALAEAAAWFQRALSDEYPGAGALSLERWSVAVTEAGEVLRTQTDGVAMVGRASDLVDLYAQAEAARAAVFRLAQFLARPDLGDVADEAIAALLRVAKEAQ